MLDVHFTDQLGQCIELDRVPERIVSLVPSQTELLFDLGLGERVVGVTRYCTEPADRVAQVSKVGGTKKFDFDAISALKPDLIIGNKEENYAEGIERLQQQHPVWMSDIYDLDDALAMIEQIALITGVDMRGNSMCADIRRAFDRLGGKSERRTFAYLIWRKPYMVVGGNNFIHHLLGRAGFVNAFGGFGRYPAVEAADITKARPEVVFLSSEPYPFTAEHVDEFESIAPAARVLLVDGAMCSWYGSRLLRVPEYLQGLCDLVGEPRRGAA